MLKNYSLNRLLVLLTTLGFFFLMVDSLIEHWGILKQEVWAYVPIVFGALGALMGAGVTIRWKEKCIRRFQILLLASIVVAGAGLYFHIEEEDEGQMTTEQREHEKNEKEKPLLAPLSFAGLAAVGLLGTARKWQAEVI